MVGDGDVGEGVGREEETAVEGCRVDARPSATIARELGALRDHWEEVLDKVRWTGDASIQALLRSCRPVAVDDQQVVIAARFGFHRTRLESDGARGAVEDALAALLGAPVTLSVVLADEEAGEAGPEEALPVGVPAGVPEELAGDPVVREAVLELGAVARVG
jgi:hypothetical protein